LLAVIEALTEMIYAIAKNVARPALISVKNLEPFLSCRCPENSSLNRRPTILLATAIFVFSTFIVHKQDPEETGKMTYPTHDSLLCSELCTWSECTAPFQHDGLYSLKKLLNLRWRYLVEKFPLFPESKGLPVHIRVRYV